jgi:lactate dehydrogenase-like 2-hydroxyacid dehydrogenase
MPLIEEGVEKAFVVHRLHQAADREALLKKIAPDVRAICTGSHTGVKTDAALMARFPNLKIIGNFGVGYDTIDIPVAAGRGVIITNTPDVLTEEVADTTIGLLLATAREFYDAEKWLRQGRWPKEGDYRLTASLRDRKVGIAGFGRIGKAIARRLEAFGLSVSYFGRKPQPSTTSRCCRTWARPRTTRAAPWANWWSTTCSPSPPASRPRRPCRRRRSKGGRVQKRSALHRFAWRNAASPFARYASRSP